MLIKNRFCLPLKVIFFNYFINQNYCYILIIPGFGIVSHVISTFTGKPVFGYIGMVKNRPTLINYYVNLLYMLGTSKTLNTSNYFVYSNKVQVITMRNQQEAKVIFNFSILRDYTRRGFLYLIESLRYSPTNSKNINLSLNSLKLILNKKLNNLSIKNNTIPVKGINSIINRNLLTSNMNVYLPFYKNKCDGSRINFHTASGLRASQEKGINAFLFQVL